MPLISLPPLDAINLSLQGNDLEAALIEMFTPLRTSEAVQNQEKVWMDLVARQAAGPVALDHDVALPHARTAGVKRIVLTAGRHPSGIAFDQEHQQVRLIFLVLTPKERPAEYLQLVASLAARLRRAEVRRELLTTNSESEFSVILRG